MENDEHIKLIDRKFHVVKESQHTFRVLQWNILADALSGSSPTENFCVVPSMHLEWQYRRYVILKQIYSSNADVICLQEVDHFYDFLQPELAKHGYTGHFVAKRDSPCLKFPGNNGPDGVAIFFKSSKYNLLKCHEKYLAEESGEEGQAALLVHMLQDLEFKRSVIIAVSHLKAKTGFEVRRHMQTKSALHYLSEFIKDIDKKVPIIWCGDFNGRPSESFYAEIRNSTLGFESAYRKGSGSEIQYSTWKIRPEGEKKGEIDYIWFTENLLQVNQLLLPMDDNDVPLTRFPSVNHGSDHIALCVDFSFT